MDPYTISQIGAKLVLIEFLNALCPQCHANAPVLNRLYKVVQKDAALAKDVKIIGIRHRKQQSGNGRLQEELQGAVSSIS